MKITAGRELLCLFNNKTLILSSVETRQTHTQKGGVNIRKKKQLKYASHIILKKKCTKNYEPEEQQFSSTLIQFPMLINSICETLTLLKKF